MLLERSRRVQQRVGPFEQVVEVHRAFLVVAELGQQDRVHRAADDRGLDHRAGIEAHHRRRMEQRIEVVGLRPGVHRHGAGGRPAHDVVEAGQRDRLPFLPALEVRAGSGCRTRAGRRGGWHEGAAPTASRTRFRARCPRAAPSTRRARSAGRRAGRPGRRTPRGVVAGCLTNHSSNTCAPVTSIRPAGTPCRSMASLLLDVVPDHHALRRERQLALARQVVPAGHGEDVADAELDRRARRDRAAWSSARRAASSRRRRARSRAGRRETLADVPVARSSTPMHARQQAPSGARRAAAIPPGGSPASARGCASRQQRRHAAGTSDRESAGRSAPAGNGSPARTTDRRASAGISDRLDARMRPRPVRSTDGGQGWLSGPLGDQQHLVAAFGQHAQHRLVVPDVRRIPDREEDAQRRGSTPDRSAAR